MIRDQETSMVLKAIVPTLMMALAFSGADLAQIEQDRSPEKDKNGEEEPTNYWEGVEFGLEDFAEVRRFVKLFYIDPSYDKRMAWLMAANFALREMDPSREILPEDYWKRKRKDRKERKRFGGKVMRLDKSDQFVIHEVGDRDVPEDKPGTLTPKEINLKKEEARRKQEELEKSFARVPFTEDDFRRVADYLTAQLRKAAPKVESNRFFVAAAKGYLASLDPHSTIISSKAWDESTKATTDSSFEGIGAVLTKKGDETIIESPMEGQPAYKTGLRAGDVIVAVDKKPVTGMLLPKVVKLIRGPKGTPVTLTIRRLGLPRDKDFVITRDNIEIKNVQKRMVEHHPDMGYVKITGFVPTTREALSDAIEQLVKEARGGRLRGLITDLRYNSGGLLQESVDVADDFLEDGVIVSVKNPSDRDEIYRATPGSFGFPVVVLINSSSASAAEILASAIQENARGLVVGDRSFGKASVQTLLNPLLRRDYYIKLTVARYYAPSGRTIQVMGVVPDIDIPRSPDGEPTPTFREEDLMHHLSRQSAEPNPTNTDLVREVLACDKKMGVGDRFIKADPNPQVKPDYQVMKAADYLECLIVLNEKKTDTAGITAE